MAQQLDVQYVRFYTDGSAARKVATAEPLKALKLPKAKKQKCILLRVDPIATMGIVVSALMLVLMFVGISQLNAAQKKANAMAAYVMQLEEEQTVLSVAYENSYDLDKVEQTALALGMVPREQVPQIRISVPNVETEHESGVLDQFYTFLTGLFA